MVTKICYHANCLDGAMAAIIAKEAHPKADLCPVSYGTPIDIEQFALEHIVFVDFCPTADDLLLLNAVASSVLVLDHHPDHLGEDFFLNNRLTNTQVVLDSTRSGATLASEYFKASCKLRYYARSVEDRDLWQFKHDNTRAICAALDLHTRSPEILKHFITETSSEEIERIGNIILDYKHRLISSMASRYYTTIWHNYIAGVIECPPDLVSELAEHIYTRDKALDIVLLYSQAEDGRIKVSLRSAKDKPEVNTVAAYYSGGGHPHAASFYIHDLTILTL